jgi:F-box-like
MLSFFIGFIPQHKTQEDTKPLLAASKCLSCLVDYHHSVLFPEIACSAAGRHRPRAVLPNELLLHTFSYVEGKRDLANLCQCSKVFRDIADGYLYRNLNLDFCFDSDFEEETAAEKLLQSLQNPRYSNIVKELRVSVHECPAVVRDGCPCDKIDMLLRKALQYAEKLEALRIQCFFCVFASPERHRYLTELPTLTLREFCSNCSCEQDETTSHFDGSSNTKHMSVPNWMCSVTSLNLASGGEQCAFPEELLQRWMQNDELLPNLHTLNYYGPGICSELLAKRVIRRLVALSADPNNDLRWHPDKKALTHLVTRDQVLETFLNSVGSINQFSNLQHIGFLWSGAIYGIPKELRVSSVLHHYFVFSGAHFANSWKLSMED